MCFVRRFFREDQHKIYKYVDEQLAKNSYDGNYCNFNEYYKTILQKFSVIAGEYLSKSTSNNPLLAYDRMYCNLYNFDTQAYQPRSAQRQIVRARLIEAMTIILGDAEMLVTDISPDIGTATYSGMKYWVVEKVKAAYIHKDQSPDSSSPKFST